MNDNDIKMNMQMCLRSIAFGDNQLAINGIHHQGDEEIHKYADEMLKDQNRCARFFRSCHCKLKESSWKKLLKEEEISHDKFLKNRKNNPLLIIKTESTAKAVVFFFVVCIMETKKIPSGDKKKPLCKEAATI
jgi:hypothetical protein